MHGRTRGRDPCLRIDVLRRPCRRSGGHAGPSRARRGARRGTGRRNRRTAFVGHLACAFVGPPNRRLARLRGRRLVRHSAHVIVPAVTPVIVHRFTCAVVRHVARPIAWPRGVLAGAVRSPPPNERRARDAPSLGSPVAVAAHGSSARAGANRKGSLVARPASSLLGQRRRRSPVGRVRTRVGGWCPR